MGGLKLIFDAEHQDFDLGITGKHLTRERGLETYVAVSMFTDARAPEGERLPAAGDDRRGWWADEFHEDQTTPFGSLLWLIADAKRTPQTLLRLQQYTRDSLRWMVPARMASSFAVAAEYLGDNSLIRTTITQPRNKHPYEAAWEVQLHAV